MEAVIWLVWILVVLIGAKVYLMATHRKCHSRRRLDGKTILITGATSGIGEATAVKLAARGARLLLACRNVQKAEIVAKRIAASTKNTKIEVRYVDLTRLQTVRALADRIRAEEEKLDVLILNAGAGKVSYPKELTEDDLEYNMAVNYFSNFLLVNSLLDVLKRSEGESRVVVVSSFFHALGTMNLENLNYEKYFYRLNAYSDAKLAEILMVKELARRLQGSRVTVNSLHPGVVRTNIFLQLPLWYRTLIGIVWFYMKTKEEGAETVVHCAACESVQGISGAYFVNCQERRPSKKAQDEKLARMLWHRTLYYVNLHDNGPDEITAAAEGNKIK
ncbi:unnamed protein product [Darwinula stevensoni]|uniref:Uncharacterized protein n=1 Tax=Darwinula stevensoni TaxID=69355 RepID=A0A7R8XAU7_9CRUS|nr:unnamed protein product [Darwinula stevensoni]CAG0890376.1 unnamed protein product [Darwinula stevensoni]